ncbi:AbrB/MazE/SpoVT family DNA-binding domain-containing protein [Lysinibacillus yapensis]|uniref:AbrB/MazE/SpoVT family DNA-binding domain-containing protein n=1 Tax=Ureibacillus yapensis TaxID=2304605 RepID=A0A396SHQ3_9BACL|nr:AbrB/MazE/SpoVT family DNA-binding domain-containing protein [Lysinibacillus yapensis]RHW31114.1 AbrB/MazE/SpoVT family DNA-binding domain-containing protein [Lysinibacillus yapensis]
MKSTGIVRKVDPLGRVVLPKELRGVLGIEEGTPLEIYMDGDKVILQKYESGARREEKLAVLLNLQRMAQSEQNPNKKDAIVRAIALIQ